MLTRWIGRVKPMTKRRTVLAVFAALLMVPAAASAQIHQVGSATSAKEGKATVNFTVGFFGLRGYNGRPSDDILVGDLQPPQPLLFQVSDLNGVPVGGEFVYGFARHLEA